MRKLPIMLALLVTLGTSLSPKGRAQAGATLFGFVRDASGAPIQDAKLTLVLEGTGRTRRLEAGTRGEYVFAALPAGPYGLTADKEGFQKFLRSNLLLQADQEARLDLTLQIEGVVEVVEVHGELSPLERRGSALGQTVGASTLETVPLNSRNFMQLATLAPGVSGVGYGARNTVMSGRRPSDPRPASEVFSTGNREQSNRYLLDGVENSFRRNGLVALRPAVESVAEFKIYTALAPANYGGKPGAIIAVVTRSGSNEWHGERLRVLAQFVAGREGLLRQP